MSRRPTVAVIDYDAGNMFSILRALEHVGASARLVAEPGDLRGCDRIVLPGVGAFGAAMAELNARGLALPLAEAARAGAPLLGICLGAQLLMEESLEFGRHAGLGLVPGRVEIIPAQCPGGARRRVPHVGWAALAECAPGGWRGTCLGALPAGTAVYFVHSYHARPAASEDLLAVADCQGMPITAAVARGSVVGCQFHPEKSGEAGLALLKAFVGSPP